MNTKQKITIYQVFTRLFGNKTTNKIPWGTIEENGVGKFADFTDKTLEKIKDLGISHIWYTGILHHASTTDYSSVGIRADDPEIVKGRAGSPYAVKDYYNVNPDLAVNPKNRLQEFKELIERTHLCGLKVIIDIVPNHVARCYKSEPDEVKADDFGSHDDTTVAYKKHNNFYYIPGEAFGVPEWQNGYTPLSGYKYPIRYKKHIEIPAKWTGNGSRKSQPDFYDWYETVKINHGIKPDGTKDFDLLPEELRWRSFSDHVEFWKNKDVPDSWIKFKDIALYWLRMGVDGFRYDMAELVPVEFWSFLNSTVKAIKPDVILIAEVYQPHLYRDFIGMGKMDYLYDKVGLYDTLKRIIQGQESTDRIADNQNSLADIEHHMLHFLENHDEQRIAHEAFAGNAIKGKPMMVLSATISSSPTMIYFGQELGETASDKAGFGSESRTTIFDYWSLDTVQRWINNGKFDGLLLSDSEKSLRIFYCKLLNFALQSKALRGEYREIHNYNRYHTEWYNDQVFSFVRWADDEKLIVVSNFNDYHTYGFELQIPEEIISKWKISEGEYRLQEFFSRAQHKLHVRFGKGNLRVDILPLESQIYTLEGWF